MAAAGAARDDDSDGGHAAYRLSITSADHPWAPRGIDPLAPKRTECMPWGRAAYLFIPMSYYISMCTAFRHLRSTDDFQLISDGVAWWYAIFGGVASIMHSYRPQVSNNGMNSGPLQLNTLTVCYGKRGTDAEDQVVGIIWTIFVARHVYDDSDLKDNEAVAKITMLRNDSRWPPSIIAAQINQRAVVDADVVRGTTDAKSAKRRAIAPNSRGGRRVQPTKFQILGATEYQRACRLYWPEDITDRNMLHADHTNPGSAYNFFQTFSLLHALQHMERAGVDASFRMAEAWETDNGLGGKEFHRPRNGATTYRVMGSELAPDRLMLTFFPHAETLPVDDDSPAMRALIQQYYQGARSADGKIAPANEEDEVALARAQQRARDAISAGKDGDADGFTMRGFIKLARQSYEKEMAQFRLAPPPPKKRGVVGPDGDDTEEDEDEDGEAGDSPLPVPEEELCDADKDEEYTFREPEFPAGMQKTWSDYRAQAVAEKAWRDKWLSKMWVVFNPSGQLTDVEKIYAKYMTKTLDAAKSFSMPWDNPYYNLTPFGGLMANKALAQEVLFGQFISHAHAIAMETALLGVPIKGKMKEHLLLLGDGSTGKSYAEEYLMTVSLPGIAQKSSGQSAAAELVEGASDQIHLTMSIWEEAKPDILGIGEAKDGGSGQRGAGSAKSQANTNAATLMRDVMASDEINYFRYSRNRETGEETRREIKIHAERAFCLATNASWADIPSNMQFRMTPLFFGSGTRSDISFAHIQSMKLTPELRVMMNAYIARFRRDQFWIFFIDFLQRWGYLLPWTTTPSDSMIIRVLERASKLGLTTSMDPRSIVRAKRKTLVAANLSVIYNLFDGPERIAHPAHWNWAATLECVRYALVATPEHALWALTTLSAEWVNPAVAEVVAAINYHFHIGVSALAEIRGTPRNDADARRLMTAAAASRSRGGRGRGRPRRAAAAAAGGGAFATPGMGGGRGRRGKATLFGARSSELAEDGFSYTTPVAPARDAIEMTKSDLEAIDPPTRDSASGRILWSFNMERFHYFTWSDANISLPITDLGRAHKFAGMIIGSMRTRYPPSTIRNIIVTWLDSKVPGSEPTLRGVPTRQCDAFVFEKDRGSSACSRLRVHKDFLVNQQDSLIWSCLQYTIDCCGFNAGNHIEFITGIASDPPYVLKTMQRTPCETDKKTGKLIRRKPFAVLDTSAANPLAANILRHMSQSAVRFSEAATDAGAGGSKYIGLVEARVLSLTRNATFRAIDDDNIRIIDIGIEHHLVAIRAVDIDIPVKFRRVVAHDTSNPRYHGTKDYPTSVIFKLGVESETMRRIMRTKKGKERHGAQSLIDALRFLRMEKKCMDNNGDEEFYWNPDVPWVGKPFPKWQNGRLPDGARLQSRRKRAALLTRTSSVGSDLEKEDEEPDDGGGVALGEAALAERRAAALEARLAAREHDPEVYGRSDDDGDSIDEGVREAAAAMDKAEHLLQVASGVRRPVPLRTFGGIGSLEGKSPTDAAVINETKEHKYGSPASSPVASAPTTGKRSHAEFMSLARVGGGDIVDSQPKRTRSGGLVGSGTFDDMLAALPCSPMPLRAASSAAAAAAAAAVETEDDAPPDLPPPPSFSLSRPPRDLFGDTEDD